MAESSTSAAADTSASASTSTTATASTASTTAATASTASPSDPTAEVPLTQVRLLLRDINPRMVAAWRHYFHDVPLAEISQGDIFNRPSRNQQEIRITADAIVSPANSFGFMDGGIDYDYSEALGWELSADLRQMIRERYDGLLPVGKAAILPTGNASLPLLISAPTMTVPLVVDDTLNAYLAFKATLEATRRYNRKAALAGRPPIRSILCPGLCTAVGRMPFMRAALQMREAYRAVVEQKGAEEFPQHLRIASLWHRSMTAGDTEMPPAVAAATAAAETDADRLFAAAEEAERGGLVARAVDLYKRAFKQDPSLDSSETRRQ